VQRPGAGHSQVVDSTVDGQLADVPAGEEQRRDHERVGGERQPGAVNREHRLVLQRLQQRVAERLQEQRLDQGGGRLAARPVGEGDPLLLQLGPPPPGLVDPLQDLLLPAELVDGRVAHARVASLTRSRVKRPKL
jgi:hypothetical protein